MAAQKVPRRLAAILATDMVGYSRLISIDEEGTLARLKALRKDLIDPRIAKYGGRIVKLMGDGMLVEFVSVVDAVRGAAEVQQAVEERNAVLPRDLRLSFRVGVNLGDVVIDGDDIYGDGVNVAARLEGLSEPGGMCISGAVYDQVCDRLDLSFQDMGEQTIKNIKRPVRVWRWIRDPSVASADRAEEPGPFPLPDKPSIAVLPFDNLSGDPKQEYLSDGIAEDIITGLSRFHWFFVIARNSSFTYRARAVDVRRVAKELGVQYVLEGSVRSTHNRLRMTVQLIDALTGRHVWAESYDREFDDIFAVQGEISSAIVAAVAPRFLAAEAQRVRRKNPARFDSWDFVMRARWHLWRFSRQDSVEAQGLLRKAIDLDATSAPALADLASLHVIDALFGWSGSPLQSLSEARAVAERAHSIDDQDDWTNAVLGLVDAVSRRHEEGIRRLRRALELNSNLAAAHGFLGWAYTFVGDTENAHREIEQAIRLSPRDPFLVLWHAALAGAAFVDGDYENAVRWARQTIEERRDWPSGHRLLAASLGQLGKEADASAAVREVLRLIPDQSVATLRLQLPYRDPNVVERFLDGLRRGGLPER